MAVSTSDKHVLDVQAVAGDLGAVGDDVEIEAAGGALGEDAAGAGHLAHDRFQVLARVC